MVEDDLDESRWLHEECAEDHKIDSIRKDRFCHYCLDLLN